MLESFITAGAYKFDWLRTNADKECVAGGYGPAHSPRLMREALPSLVEIALNEQTNLIIRPHAQHPAVLLQLDDLSADMLKRIQPIAFLVIATSAAGRQAWVAAHGCDSGFCRRVRERLGADLGANGWVRVAGTLNVKRRYAPNFPTVRIETAQPRAKVRPEEFHGLGFVAPEPSAGVDRASHPVNGKGPNAFPSYERCLKGAPVTAAGQKDRSLADFTWCCIGIRWGWSVIEVADRLSQEPLSKAHERGWKYAVYTAEKAAAAVAADPSRAR
jgi:hypothetical protein